MRAVELQRLSQLPPRQRLEALVHGPEARALVRAMPSEQLYATVAEVGLADAAEAVQLASPAQFQALVDLGGWKKDALDPQATLEWLRAARGDDAEEALRKVHVLDLEVLEAMLRALTRVHDLEATPDPEVSHVTLDSADGHYRIELLVEGPEQAALRALLIDLMAEDPLGFSRLMEAVRWEVPSELEETALRFRWARLSDLGFPDPESAAGLYSQVPIPEQKGVPAALAVRGSRANLITSALAGLDAEELQAAEEELRGVYNAALVADGADPGDLQAFQASAERARDTLGLGLELLTGGDPARATEVLRETPLRRIFQIGFSLGLRLKHRADRLAARPLARVDGQWLLWPAEEAALSALRRARPLRALPVEGAEPVPFRSLAELDATSTQLTRAERQQRMLSALLGGDEETARAALHGLGAGWPAGGTPAVLSAALSQALLGGPARVAPVPSARTGELGQQLLSGSPPRLRPEAVSRATDALRALAPDTGDEPERLARAVLERLVDQIGPALLSGPLPREVQTTLPWTDGTGR